VPLNKSEVDLEGKETHEALKESVEGWYPSPPVPSSHLVSVELWVISTRDRQSADANTLTLALAFITISS